VGLLGQAVPHRRGMSLECSASSSLAASPAADVLLCVQIAHSFTASHTAWRGQQGLSVPFLCSSPLHVKEQADLGQWQPGIHPGGHLAFYTSSETPTSLVLHYQVFCYVVWLFTLPALHPAHPGDPTPASADPGSMSSPTFQQCSSITMDACSWKGGQLSLPPEGTCCVFGTIPRAC